MENRCVCVCVCIAYCIIHQSKLNVWMLIATENEFNECMVCMVTFWSQIPSNYGMQISNSCVCIFFNMFSIKMTVRTGTAGRSAAPRKIKSNRIAITHSILNIHIFISFKLAFAFFELQPVNRVCTSISSIHAQFSMKNSNFHSLSINQFFFCFSDLAAIGFWCAVILCYFCTKFLLLVAFSRVRITHPHIRLAQFNEII